jgi:hypothetical protein
LSQFYSACQAELTSSAGYNAQVRELYDILYVVNPLKGAVCSIDSANQEYCVNEILAIQSNSTGKTATNASTTSASAASASASGAANSTVLLANFAAEALTPVQIAANNLYITVSSAASGIARRFLDQLNARQVQQSTFATVITPNSTTYRTTNLPFLFLQPSFTSSQLCTPCTREIMVAYIKWESAVPYALGLSASPILGGQLALWNAINSTCGTNYVNAINAEVGVIAAASNMTSGAGSLLLGSGSSASVYTAVLGAGVVAGAMALLA